MGRVIPGKGPAQKSLFNTRSDNLSLLASMLANGENSVRDFSRGGGRSKRRRGGGRRTEIRTEWKSEAKGRNEYKWCSGHLHRNWMILHSEDYPSLNALRGRPHSRHCTRPIPAFPTSQQICSGFATRMCRRAETKGRIPFEVESREDRNEEEDHKSGNGIPSSPS